MNGHLVYKKNQSTMDDVLEVLSGFESGNFSNILPPSEDQSLKLLVDRLNATSKFLAVQAQRAVLDQNKFLETVLSSLPGLVSYMDRELRYLYVNNAYEKWFGVSREKCLTSTMTDVVGAAGVDSVKQYLTAAYDGKPQEFEREVPYKHGGTRNIHVQYVPDKTPEGSTRGIIVIVNDITEIKKANAERDNALTAAVESSSRIHALFKQSADPIMTLAPPSWKFTSCNPSTLELFGAGSEEEFKNLGPWDVSPERQPDGVLSADKAPQMILNAMKAGSHFFEWNHQTLSGKVIPCTVLLSRIDTGFEQYLQATVRDVSKEREALASLKEKTDELSNIYLNSPLGIIELDANFKITRTNPAYQEMLGFSESELLGKSMLDLTYPDDKLASEEKAKSISDHGRQFDRFEKRYLSKTGRVVWASVTSRALKHSSGSIRYLSIIENVSEKKANRLMKNSIFEA